MFNSEIIRMEFPLLKRDIKGKRLIYFDNAATTQKPQSVIDAISTFYAKNNANIHRGIHTLGEEATLLYEEAHKKAAGFINAPSWRQIIFTKNTTEAMNLLAYTLPQLWKKGDEIIITEHEHHSNYIPWQQSAKRHGLHLKICPLTHEGLVDTKKLQKLLTEKTRLVSIAHVSNVLGGINDIKAIATIVHAKKSLLCVDGAQSVPHMPIDVQDIDCDFLCFSSHKMLGPFGIGILYGKKTLLEKMPPFLFGGGMVDTVGKETTWNELPWKFEAGTPDIAGAVGFSAAVTYLQNIGMNNVFGHDQEITAYALQQLKKQKDVIVYGPEKRSAVISFNIKKIHAHDVAALLNEEGIACRAGHHCAQPLFHILKVPAAVRVSFYIYNTHEEVDEFIAALDNVRKVFA